MVLQDLWYNLAIKCFLNQSPCVENIWELDKWLGKAPGQPIENACKTLHLQVDASTSLVQTSIMNVKKSLN